MNNYNKLVSFSKSTFLILILLISSSSFAQYFEFSWSDDYTYANNKDGFFNGFINSNDQFIYALNVNYAKSKLHSNEKIKLIAYNKKTMAETAFVNLKGFAENKSSKKEYDAIDYFKTIVLNDRILVFWKKLINTDTLKTEILYVETFKSGLERDKALTQIYISKQPVNERQSDFSPTNLVVFSNKENGEFVIGSEILEGDKKSVFNYQVLNSQLVSKNKDRVVFPINCELNLNGQYGVYELGQDGNIYIRSKVTISKEDQVVKYNKRLKSHLVLTVVNPIQKKQIQIELKDNKKIITDFNFIVTSSKTRLYGFFGDLQKDPSGVDKQGIFYTEVDNDTLVNNPLKFTYFEKSSLNKLFPKSKGGRKNSKDPIKQLTEEELNTRFDIENLFLMEDNSVVLFFTRKYNYSEKTSSSGLDGKNEYKTDFYCEKNNVSAIRFSENGQIMWTSSLDRSVTYEGTDITDLNIIRKFNKFYVIYGQEEMEDKAVDNKEIIEYAIFDPNSGRPKKYTFPVNGEDVLENDKKYIDVKTVKTFDDSFYFNKMKVKQKMVWNLANIICLPTIYYSVLSGNTKYGKGDLCVLNLMEGKPNKKKSKK